MFRLFYNLLFHLAYLLMLPHFLWRMRRRGGYRQDFGERVFRVSEAKRARLSEGRKVWIHAVSVGELGVGLAFLEEWRSRHPGAEFVVTVNTSTAHRIAEEKLDPRDVLLYPPLDSPWVVRRMLNAVDLEAVVLVETEMWPNLLWGLEERGVPVLLLNGRISDRSYRRLKQVHFYTRRIFPLVGRFCMQSEGDARRARRLGAPGDRVRVLHSAKYDGLTRDRGEEGRRRDRLLAAGFLEADSVVVLGSSTWPGEERVLMEGVRELRTAFPRIRLILVPRHFERRAEVLAEADKAGMRVACWSDASDAELGAAEAVLVDTTGELKHFTGFADRVFIGKSLFRAEGQNPLEAAHAGKWMVAGPGMDNFRQIMHDLRDAGAVHRVRGARDLVEALRESLANPAEAEAQGERAAALVRNRQGALARSAEELEGLLG